MSDRKIAWAIRLVRWWTRVYTTGLPPEQRRARQEEIDSDLWEQAQDGNAGATHRTALQIVGRMLLGVLEDLTWRVEQIGEVGGTATTGRRWAMNGTFGRVVLGALWLVVGVWLLYNLVPGAIRGFTTFELQGAIASFLPVLLLSAGVLLTGLALLLRRRRARLATLVFAPLLLLYGAGGIVSSVFYFLNLQRFQQRDPELTWLTPLGIAASSVLLVVLGVWALWLVLSKRGRGAFIQRPRA